MPKVSVIIPVYGVEQCIERCARSLFEQTLDDIEFLFIDDCTPDLSIQILNNVLKDYPSRVPLTKIIKMEKNSGQAAVRTKGLYLATGDYIIHCDSDDWVDKTMYEQMYSLAIKGNYDCVICGFTRTNGVDSHVEHIENVKTTLFEDLLRNNLSLSLWNKMYSRLLFNKETFLPPVGNMGEDAIINFQLSLNCKNVGVINKSLYYYFENINSICTNPTLKAAISRFRESYKNVPILIDFFKSNGLYEKYKTNIIEIIVGKRVWLIPHLNNDDCYRLWKNAYPELNKELLLNIRISIKTKIRFILNYLRIRV